MLEHFSDVTDADHKGKVECPAPFLEDSERILNYIKFYLGEGALVNTRCQCRASLGFRVSGEE